MSNTPKPNAEETSDPGAARNPMDLAQPRGGTTPRCHARAKGSQAQCRRQAMRGRAVCYMHGGATPVGIASPHFRTGTRSKYLDHLPDALAPHFDRENPQLVGLLDELALTDSRIIEVLERIKAGQASPPWVEVQVVVAQFARARASKDAPGVIRAIDQLDAVLTRAVRGASEGEQLTRLMELRYKLVAVESRRQKDQAEMVAQEDFGRFAKAVLMAVASRIPDLGVRAKIQEDVLRILGIGQRMMEGEPAS